MPFLFKFNWLRIQSTATTTTTKSENAKYRFRNEGDKRETNNVHCVNIETKKKKMQIKSPKWTLNKPHTYLPTQSEMVETTIFNGSADSIHFLFVWIIIQFHFFFFCIVNDVNVIPLHMRLWMNQWIVLRPQRAAQSRTNG